MNTCEVSTWHHYERIKKLVLLTCLSGLHSSRQLNKLVLIIACARTCGMLMTNKDVLKSTARVKENQFNFVKISSVLCPKLATGVC